MKEPNIVYLAINLPSSIERREHIQQQGASIGITVQIVEAVSGKTLTDEQKQMYDSRKRESMYITHLTPNEQACVHSHRKALGTFLATTADYAVVLEDDATFEPGFLSGIKHLTTSIPGWECCKLYTEPSKLYTLCPPIENAPVQPVFPKKIPWGAIGYLYSRAGAEKILAHFDSFWLGADTQLADIMLKHHIPVIGVVPNLVGTLYAHNEQSDIDDGGQRNTVTPATQNAPVRYKRSALQYLRYRFSVIERAVGKWLMCRQMRSIFKKTIH